jgi:hypothetical protein
VILEGIVTTLAPDGTLNVAPMGPKLGRDPRRFTLRPYQTSTTYRNLKATGEGVLHVTDDVLLLARAAIGMLPTPATRPAGQVRGGSSRPPADTSSFGSWTWMIEPSGQRS